MEDGKQVRPKTSGRYVRQEEFREYFMDEYQEEIIKRHFRNLQAVGLATEPVEDTYYVSQKKYRRAAIVNINSEDHLFSLIGDSIILGKIKRDVEIKAGKLETTAHMKAQPGVENMGFQ